MICPVRGQSCFVFFLIPHKREYFFGAYSHVISKPFGEATGRIDIGIQHFAKFEYLPETKEDENDPSYFELRLEVNELTQTTFLKVTDYSDFDDQEELQDLWEGLVANLKKVIGG